MSSKEWFASWFDTSFYHLLYRDRNEEEAKKFILNLLNHLELPANSHVLDLACGKGRHSITLNELGMQVLGVDLSEQSILHAKQFENEKLKFRVQDMRFPLENKTFDCIFNLFTSFGYFDDDLENSKVLEGISTMLKPSGQFVFDYLNSVKALRNLVEREEKAIENVHFRIRRHFDGKFIRKKIEVDCEKQHYSFEEKVRGFSKKEITKMVSNAGLSPCEWFGDFDLNPFDVENSDRMILICKKK